LFFSLLASELAVGIVGSSFVAAYEPSSAHLTGNTLLIVGQRVGKIGAVGAFAFEFESGLENPLVRAMEVRV
jgi:hypothetical protein